MAQISRWRRFGGCLACRCRYAVVVFGRPRVETEASAAQRNPDMSVQKLRLKHGWSQQQLADASGLSVRTVQRIEAGDPASTESLKSLAAVFEVDFSTLNPEPAMNTTTRTPTEHNKSKTFLSRCASCVAFIYT